MKVANYIPESLLGMGEIAFFEGLESLYRINSDRYKSTYWPDGKRAVMLIEKAIKHIKVEPLPESHGPTRILNRFLDFADACDKVGFVCIKDIDSALENANMKDVQQQLRGYGYEFADSVAVPEKFGRVAEKASRSFLDIAAGARFERFEIYKCVPRSGDLTYECPKSVYPFHGKDSPAETSFLSVFSGASSSMHGKDVRLYVEHDDTVLIHLRETKYWERGGPEWLDLTI